MIDKDISAADLVAHEFALWMPEMSVTDYEALRDDIEQQGQSSPIVVLHGTNRILDGRHRLKACREIGREPRVRVWAGTQQEAARLVVSLNARRRHLNSSQLALIAAKLADLPRGRPVSPRAVIPPIGGITSNMASQPMSTKQASVITGASVRSIERARQASKAIPEVMEAIQKGEVSCNTGADISKLPRSDQLEAVNNARSCSQQSKETKQVSKAKMVRTGKQTHDRMLKAVKQFSMSPNLTDELRLSGASALGEALQILIAGIDADKAAVLRQSICCAENRSVKTQ